MCLCCVGKLKFSHAGPVHSEAKQFLEDSSHYYFFLLCRIVAREFDKGGFCSSEHLSSLYWAEPHFGLFRDREGVLLRTAFPMNMY